MKDLLNKILVAAAGLMLAVTFATFALVAGRDALGSADGFAADAPLLAMVAGVLAAGVARGIRTARAASGRASRRVVAARWRRLGSPVRHPSL